MILDFHHVKEAPDVALPLSTETCSNIRLYDKNERQEDPFMRDGAQGTAGQGNRR